MSDVTDKLPAFTFYEKPDFFIAKLRNVFAVFGENFFFHVLKRFAKRARRERCQTVEAEYKN